MKDELVRLMKEQEDKKMEISALKSELGTAKRTYEAQFSQLEEEAKGAKAWTEKAQEYEYQLKVLQNKVLVSLHAKQYISTCRGTRQDQARGFSLKTNLDVISYCYDVI